MNRQPGCADHEHPPRTNPPVRRDRLIGREREARALGTLLLREDVGLVTLTGAGGSGKTRLALQVASELRDQFPDGFVLVTLGSISDPALVPSAIAQVLGLEEAGERPLIEVLQSLLRDKRLLLLLDNFEQVLDAAPLLIEMLSTCPGLTVLVTSRVLLRVSGEHEFPLQPLTLPDLRTGADSEAIARSPAVELYLRRVQAVLPDFSLTDTNARTVAEICVRLDGLPLALELAAARLRVLSPDALLQRLGNRLNLLSSGPRDLPSRQQTLRAAMTWSYDLLTNEEQRLFRRLAPFVGGIAIDAAEAVVNDQEPVPARGGLLDGITALVENSLLRPIPSIESEPRFAMLETIREYAIERLEESEEAPAIRRRHACYFLDLIERAEPSFFGGQWTVLIETLEAEHDNLRAALQWAMDGGEIELALRLAGALAWFWYDHGHLGEGRRWLDAALAHANHATPAVRAKALIGAGGLAHRQYDLQAARRHLESGLELSRALSDDWSTALALINLGLVVHDQGNYALARRLHEESLVLCRAAGNAWGVATSLSNLAWSSLFAGDLDHAREVAHEALALRRELNDRLGMAYTLYTLGRVALEEGRESESRSYLAESVDLFRELGERWGLAACLEALAISNADSRHGAAGAVQAARFWGAAEALRQTIGAPLTPADLQVHQRHQAKARVRVEAADWDIAWNEGRALPLDDMLTTAFDEGAEAMASPSEEAFPRGLTAREVEVLRLVADGLTNTQVADRLFLSPRTVGQHLRSIYTKLDVNSRTAAARFAIEHDLA